MAAIFVALGPGLIFTLRGINTQSNRLSGSGVAGGFWKAFSLPLFWILAVSFFALFFAASRLQQQAA